MTTDDGEGVLAIWNNVRAGQEAAFEVWYQHEHLPERLGVPGFLLGRRWDAVRGDPKYFCYYIAERPETFVSPPYLARLNDPTPQTRQVMTSAFTDMIRTVCRRATVSGGIRGAWCVTARFSQPVDVAPLTELLREVHTDPGIARWEIWSAADVGATPAAEEKIRGGDRRIAGCVLVETLRQSDAAAAHDRLARRLGPGVELGLYQLTCELEASGSP
jgi:hypothetical protein